LKKRKPAILRITIGVQVLTLLAALFVLAPGCAGKPVPTMNAYYQVGQRAETTREMLTVISPERTDSYPNGSVLGALTSGDIKAPAGLDFVIIEATVINVGQSSFGISPKDFVITDSEGHKWPQSKYLGKHPYPSQKVGPGFSANGHIVFAVPQGIGGFEVSCIMYGTPTVLAVWTLPF